METNNTKEIEEALIKSINKKEELTKEKLELASKIGFKDVKEELEQTDQYGFILDSKKQELIENIDEKELNKRKLRENARLEKWNKMLSNFDDFYKNNFEKLKTRTRKGIPDSIRGLIWQKYAEIDSYRYKPENVNLYQDLLKEENSDLEIESVILKDIDRTFPKHTLFKDKYGLGQRYLFNVLRAYSKHNKKIGYVQGMGFICALLLTYMEEESAFWIVNSLIEKYDMEGYYLMNFPGLEKAFYIMMSLVKKLMPKLYELFKKNLMHPSMFASQWFITIFAVNLKFDILVRIFDVFLLEGQKIFYRFALAILKINEERLLKTKSFEDCMNQFKNLYEHLDVEDLFQRSFKFSLSKNHIQEYAKSYLIAKETFEKQKSSKDEIYNFVKL